MTRDPSYPDADHPLLRAARGNDAAIDSDIPMKDAVAEMGVDLAAASHLARHRAKLMLEASPVLADPDWVGAAIAAGIFDGICIGWQAHKLAAGGYGIGAQASSVAGEPALDKHDHREYPDTDQSTKEKTI